MKYLLISCFVFILAVVPFAMTGCKPKPPATEEKASGADSHADHDHHGHDHGKHGVEDHPETYAEAVAELESLHAAIRDAFTKKDKDAAHDPLHHVGHLLEDIAGLAEKASLSTEQSTAVKKAKEELFDGYTKIDGMFHGEKEVRYEDLAKELDAALVVLQSAVKKEVPKSEETAKELPKEKPKADPKLTPEETSKDK